MSTNSTRNIAVSECLWQSAFRRRGQMPKGGAFACPEPLKHKYALSALFFAGASTVTPSHENAHPGRDIQRLSTLVSILRLTHALLHGLSCLQLYDVDISGPDDAGWAQVCRPHLTSHNPAARAEHSAMLLSPIWQRLRLYCIAITKPD